MSYISSKMVKAMLALKLYQSVVALKLTPFLPYVENRGGGLDSAFAAAAPAAAAQPPPTATNYHAAALAAADPNRRFA